MSDFVENDQGVHLLNPICEYTLCGDALEGDGFSGEDNKIKAVKNTKKKTVTCPRCIEIIKACRGVRTNPKASRE